jgi:hypothetical protein
VSQHLTQDIHGWVEVAWNPPDEWAAVISLDILVERNPSLWGWVFQARGLFPSVADDRGLPDDVSIRVRQETDMLREVTHEGEIHSFTWVSWREIDAIDWSVGTLDGGPPTATMLVGERGPDGTMRRRLIQRELRRRRDTLEGSPGWTLLMDLMRRLAADYGPDNVRAVVWFEG